VTQKVPSPGAEERLNINKSTRFWKENLKNSSGQAMNNTLCADILTISSQGNY
jgi:hypothetical protein